MAPVLRPDFQPIMDGHEDRLQRVESNVQDLVAKTTEIGVKQDYLAASVSEQGQAITNKLDHGFQELNQSHQGLLHRHSQLENRLEPLEATAAAGSRRWELIKKVMLPLLAGAAGVFGTRFSENIWVWIQS